MIETLDVRDLKLKRSAEFENTVNSESFIQSKSQTTDVICYKFEKFEFSLIDSPGMNDTAENDDLDNSRIELILRTLGDVQKRKEMNIPDPCAFLFVLNISVMKRVDPTTIKWANKLKTIFTKNAASKMIVLFTRCSDDGEIENARNIMRKELDLKIPDENFFAVDMINFYKENKGKKDKIVWEDNYETFDKLWNFINKNRDNLIAKQLEKIYYAKKKVKEEINRYSLELVDIMKNERELEKAIANKDQKYYWVYKTSYESSNECWINCRLCSESCAKFTNHNSPFKGMVATGILTVFTLGIYYAIPCRFCYHSESDHEYEKYYKFTKSIEVTNHKLVNLEEKVSNYKAQRKELHKNLISSYQTLKENTGFYELFNDDYMDRLQDLKNKEKDEWNKKQLEIIIQEWRKEKISNKI